MVGGGEPLQRVPDFAGVAVEVADLRLLVGADDQPVGIARFGEFQRLLYALELLRHGFGRVLGGARGELFELVAPGRLLLLADVQLPLQIRHLVLERLGVRPQPVVFALQRLIRLREIGDLRLQAFVGLRQLLHPRIPPRLRLRKLADFGLQRVLALGEFQDLGLQRGDPAGGVHQRFGAGLRLRAGGGDSVVLRRRLGIPHNLVNARCERGNGVLRLFALLPPLALIRDIIGGQAYGLILGEQRLKLGERLRRVHDSLAVEKLSGIPIRRIRAQKRQLFGVFGDSFFQVVVEGGGKLALGVFLAHQRLQPLRETRDFLIPVRRLRGQVAEMIEYHGQRPCCARGGVG